MCFYAFPALLAWLRASGTSFPVLGTLAVVALVAYLVLRRSEDFERARLTRWRFEPRQLGRIAVHFALGSALLAGYVLACEPERWLEFPRRATGTWALVMVFYPLVSVYPQELLYRALFLHRYAVLFGRGRGAALASALAFGWVHVIFLSGFAVALSAVGGYLFARTYQRSASIPCASLEHALYGCLIFTIGLGRHFYAAS